MSTNLHKCRCLSKWDYQLQIQTSENWRCLLGNLKYKDKNMGYVSSSFFILFLINVGFFGLDYGMA